MQYHSLLLFLSCSSSDDLEKDTVAGGAEEDTAVENHTPTLVIESPLSGDAFDEYETIAFSGSVSDDRDRSDALAISWESDLQGILHQDPPTEEGESTFDYSSLLPGEHEIMLSVTDSDGARSSDSIQISIIDQYDEPSIVIQEPTDTLLEVGVETRFSVQVSDGQDEPVDLSPLFSSDLDGAFCEAVWESPDYYTCDSILSLGFHTLTFTVTDTHGYVSSIEMNVDVVLPEDYDNDGDGYTENQGDCDDSNPLTHPDALESCDFADNNCDDLIDNDPYDGTLFYADVDEDGYGDPNSTINACSLPEGYVFNDNDCNDSESLAWTGNVETCDEVDNDCNGTIDEGVKNTYYYDMDEDGYGDPSSSIESCSAPTGYVDNDGDCNDNEPLAWTSHLELCFDGVDNDCDSDIDEPGALGCSIYYEDSDADGYGNLNSSLCLCEITGAFNTTNTMDCDDQDAWTFPGAAENESTFYCMTDEDEDGFGSDSPASGVTAGLDCYDQNSSANPDQTDFFEVDRGDSSFDYNCDGQEEGLINQIYGGTITNCSEGWQNSIPDCGNTGLWQASCVIPPSMTTRSKTQSCR
ncbi:MAG: putative metal-binding motif-containing protein [Myxococcota bacterium]|nr:putative metal-binding motif-containing protein [Myxococcota bacterium]